MRPDSGLSPASSHVTFPLSVHTGLFSLPQILHAPDCLKAFTIAVSSAWNPHRPVSIWMACSYPSDLSSWFFCPNSLFWPPNPKGGPGQLLTHCLPCLFPFGHLSQTITSRMYLLTVLFSLYVNTKYSVWDITRNKKWVLDEWSPQTPSYSSNKAHVTVNTREQMSLLCCKSKQPVKHIKIRFQLRSQKIFFNWLCWAGKWDATIINTFNLKQVAIWSVPHWLLGLGPFKKHSLFFTIFWVWFLRARMCSGGNRPQFPSSHLMALFILTRQGLSESWGPRWFVCVCLGLVTVRRSYNFISKHPKVSETL